ncbi:MAG: phosphoribosylformylglycinamidine synthase, partial [Candidatus Omnitrophica bacterium]|nr:phosphoribosylformylglycinamidine synthase [Candidatus Omnitrophota bacterium]
MLWKIEVRQRPSFFDALGAAVKKDITDLGLGKVDDVRVEQLYFIDGDFTKEDIEKIASEALFDPITEEFVARPVRSPVNRESISDGARCGVSNGVKTVEIFYNPGVMDPWEESVKKAILDLGFDNVDAIKTAKRYLIKGEISDEKLKIAGEKLLYNRVIQNTRTCPIRVKSPKYKFRLNIIDILGLDRKGLIKLSRDGQLFLNLDEMLTIKEYFKKLGRNPTDCELETIAQTWSEHCGHKTFRSKIVYSEQLTVDSKTVKSKKLINNLLKSTIMKVTKELNKPWCVSVFKDNAGIIEFDNENNICFKVETHNHPSALEPYGGAGTGIGGVIRDIL